MAVDGGTSPVLTLQTRVRQRARRAARRGLDLVVPPEGVSWDRAAGVSTEEVGYPGDLTVPQGSVADGHVYLPTPPRLLRVWLDRLREPLLPTATFIDMGSGRGRVLLIASERAFRRVLGVEFTSELHESALENIRRFPDARMRCRDVTSVLGDAAAFDFPAEPLVLYFDNPFNEKIMTKVVANLAASYERVPRPIVLVYQQLIHEYPGHRTNNLGLLDRQSFLHGETLTYRLRDRPFLSPFIVRIYTSPEATDWVAGRSGAS